MKFHYQLTTAFAIVLGVVLYVAPASLRAAEQTSEHRIVGLFSPDRVNDLHKVLDDISVVHLDHLDYETARGTFRYDLKDLFPTLNPRKPPTDAEIEQALSHLLSEASNATFSLTPCSKLPKDKLTKLEIKIGILDCKGCRYAVHLMAMKEDGVEQAIVDKTLIMWVDPAKANQAAIEAVLKKAGVGLLDEKDVRVKK